MSTEGLPLNRQERGTEDRGLLAGADFLSVFMSSSLRQAYTETTTEVAATTIIDNYTRAPRSTSLAQTTHTEENSFYDTTSSDKFSENGESRTIAEVTTVGQDDEEKSFLASEQKSIIAEANKSEFSVEESEPITTRDLSADFSQSYPARVHALSGPENPGYHSSYKDSVIQPIQHTVIYHNNPRDQARARSVSYSTVIQSVPHSNAEKHWEEEKHERHERHFDGAQSPYNNFHNDIAKITNNSEVNDQKWDKTTNRNSFTITTEKNWEIPEKPYNPPLPTVYGKPEQNYEIDESASVMTNGRLHGIQPIPTLPSKQEVKINESKKTDDNQKVGYVVEGRNYRKYRVEERTSDGFIVGEYGVVSHDDGSLRGVRYTADGTISPRLIYDALMKFLAL